MIKSDGVALGAACSLIIAAAGVGAWLLATGVRIEVYSPPLFGWLSPRVGPGTPVVIMLAIVAVVLARRCAATWPWRRVIMIGYLTAIGWTVSLAMIDGWSGGLGSRLTIGHEDLH